MSKERFENYMRACNKYYTVQRALSVVQEQQEILRDAGINIKGVDDALRGCEGALYTARDQLGRECRRFLAGGRKND